LTAFCLCSCHVNWGYVVSVFSIGGFDWICLRCCLQEMVLPLGRTQRVRALERMSRNVRQHDTRDAVHDSDRTSFRSGAAAASQVRDVSLPSLCCRARNFVAPVGGVLCHRASNRSHTRNCRRVGREGRVRPRRTRFNPAKHTICLRLCVASSASAAWPSLAAVGATSCRARTTTVRTKTISPRAIMSSWTAMYSRILTSTIFRCVLLNRYSGTVHVVF
jgi:hypothetical protein